MLAPLAIPTQHHAIELVASPRKPQDNLPLESSVGLWGQAIDCTINLVIEVSFQLPQAVHLQEFGGKLQKEQVDLARLAIAGYFERDFPLSKAKKEHLGRDSLWPVPLLLLDGQPVREKSKADRQMVEYYGLGLNHMDGTWNLRNGWDMLAVRPYSDTALPYQWISDGRVNAWIFEEPSDYNQREFEEWVNLTPIRLGQTALSQA